MGLDYPVRPSVKLFGQRSVRGAGFDLGWLGHLVRFDWFRLLLGSISRSYWIYRTDFVGICSLRKFVHLCNTVM